MKLDDQTHAPLPHLPSREADSHKGDYGRTLLVGGSRGMSGAISLAGKAALRSGAGLVTLAVPRDVQDVVAIFEPSYMTHGLADANGQFAASAAEEILAISLSAMAVAIGPGLGRSADLAGFVLRLYREIAKPVVVDADGLFALSRQVDVLTQPGGPRVLTPHPGEFARLTGQPYDAAQRIEAAATLAQRDATRNTVVVLKGHRTIVTDGSRVSVNQTGNPGMATGGTGDVLTGVITAMLCQGLQPFDAARLGAHVHGLAGDLAANELGEVSLIASDLIDFLPKAFRSIS
jgi:ADP-dependent NAD(P)H-hydrate dehydratase